VPRLAGGEYCNLHLDRYNIVDEDDLKLSVKRVQQHIYHDSITVEEFAAEPASDKEEALIVYH